MVRMSCSVVDPNKRETMESAHRELVRSLTNAIRGGCDPNLLVELIPSTVDYGYIEDDECRAIITEFVIQHMDPFKDTCGFFWAAMISADFDAVEKCRTKKLKTKQMTKTAKISKQSAKKPNKRDKLSKRSPIDDEKEVSLATTAMNELTERINTVAITEARSPATRRYPTGEQMTQELIIQLLSYKKTCRIPFQLMENNNASVSTKEKLVDGLQDFWRRGPLSHQKIRVFEQALKVVRVGDAPSTFFDVIEEFFQNNESDPQIDARYQLWKLRRTEHPNFEALLIRAARSPVVFDDLFYHHIGEGIGADANIVVGFLLACGMKKVMDALCLSPGFFDLIVAHIDCPRVKDFITQVLNNELQEVEKGVIHVDGLYLRLVMGPRGELLSFLLKNRIMEYDHMIVSLRDCEAFASLKKNPEMQRAMSICAEEAPNDDIRELIVNIFLQQD